MDQNTGRTKALLSLQHSWTLLRRQWKKLYQDSRTSVADEAVFFDLRDGLVNRYERLGRVLEPAELPQVFREALTQLAGVESMTSLSDEQGKRLAAQLDVGDRSLKLWLDRRRRLSRLSQGIGNRFRFTWFRTFVFAPVLFAVLVILFVALAVKLYVNH